MIERTLAFGENGGLVGTLCLPSHPVTESKGVGQILFNAGLVHRVGPHRINVRLARQLARRGIPSIRFDLSGQGDSARSSGQLSFDNQAVADIRSAMDALEEAAKVHRFVLFGFCSGGWHSYATAPVDGRVAGILLYDTYFYRTPRSRLIRYIVPIRKRELLKTVVGWAGRLPSTLARRIRGWTGAEDTEVPSTNPGYDRTPPKAAFAEQVRLLHERGTKVAVMHSGGFQHYYNYRDQFRDAFRDFGITEIVRYNYFPGMGHTALVIAEQAEFMQRIEDWTAELDAECRQGTAAPDS